MSGVEFRVHFTDVDSLGDEETVSGVLTESQAYAEQERILARQEAYFLPGDASIFHRIDGGPWQRWAGENR